MLAVCYEFYIRVYQSNTVDFSNINNKEIFIPSAADFDNVVQILSKQEILIDVNSFIWLAKKKKYDNNVKPGRYVIAEDLNNNDLINLLRSGKQDPVNVTFNNVRTIEQLASKIAVQIEADSASIINYITDVPEYCYFENDRNVKITLPVERTDCIDWSTNFIFMSRLSFTSNA